MVNAREIKRFEGEFKSLLDERKKTKNCEFKLSGIIASERKNSNIDISKLISCSENYYEDLNKIYFGNEFVYVVFEDKKIGFDGTGILYVVVEKDCILEFDFSSKKFNSSYVKVLVKSGVKVNSIIYCDTKEGWNNVEFFLEENSDVVLSEFIFGAKFLHVKARLEKGSKYDLKSAYYLKNSDGYILNKVVHLCENSISNLEVNGAAVENSKVICEGFVNISQNAKKSVAHQNLKGLILDNTSSISGEPILQIENSNVKCSHGFSVSQISDEILFYMGSRGLSKQDATWLVIGGFFEMEDERWGSGVKLKKNYMKLIEKKF